MSDQAKVVYEGNGPEKTDEAGNAVLLVLAAKANEICRKISGADVTKVRIIYGDVTIRLEK